MSQVIVTEVQMDGEEVAEMVLRSSASETLGRRNAVKRQIHSALMYTATGGVVRL